MSRYIYLNLGRVDYIFHNMLITGKLILNEIATAIMDNNGVLRVLPDNVELLYHTEFKRCPVESSQVCMGHVPWKDGEISI